MGKRIISITLLVLLIAGVGFGTLLKDNILGMSLRKVNAKDRNLFYKNELQHAVIATADAYWRRGTAIQYEPRLKYYHKPESATIDNIQYGTCNTFTYNVYKEALGISTPLSSISAVSFFNEKSKYAVLALDGKGFEKCIKKGLESTILPKMEPGDLILYRSRNNKDGHAQMVYSLIDGGGGKILDAWLIHGTTAGINNNAEEKRISRYDSAQMEGSVQKIRFSEFYKRFKETDPRKPNYINYFVLLRPTLNGKTWTAWDNYSYDDTQKAKRRDSSGKVVFGKDKNGNEIRTGVKKVGTEREENIQITASAKDRMKFEGIYITKTNNYKNKTIVPINAGIVYTVTIKNNSNNNYKNLAIRERIPDNTRYVTGGDRFEKNTVIWNGVDIPAGKTKTFSYTVKTPETIGTKLIAKGSVNSIETTTVRNICGKVFSDKEIERIRESFYKLRNTSVNNGFRFVNEVYADAFGRDLGLNELTASDVLDDNNNITALNHMETLLHNDNQYDYKRQIRFYYDYEGTMRLYHTARIKEINLHPGEIVLSSKDNINNAFIYLGDEIVGKNSDGVVIYRSAEEKDQFLKDLYFADGIKGTDGKYIARNKYRVKNIVISPANVIK